MELFYARNGNGGQRAFIGESQGRLQGHFRRSQGVSSGDLSGVCESLRIVTAGFWGPQGPGGLRRFPSGLRDASSFLKEFQGSSIGYLGRFRGLIGVPRTLWGASKDLSRFQ